MAASPAGAQTIATASPQNISNARRPTTSSAVRPPSRAVQEARFLRSVDPQKSANLVTGDLSFYTGSHVDYECSVDTIVRPGTILGQCGSEAEPIDLFVRLPTAHLRVGERLRILGVMDAPASWTDVTGHTVYYAFLHAVFVDSLR
jgi:hypothetical protein